VVKNPRAIPREQTYALYEMMHANPRQSEDRLGGESAHEYFTTLPTDHLVGSLPESVRGGGERVPGSGVYVRDGEAPT